MPNVEISSLTIIGVGGGQTFVQAIAHEAWLRHVSIYDPQVFEEGNEQQSLFEPKFLGESKAHVAAGYISRKSAHIQVNWFQRRFLETDPFCNVVVLAVHTKRAREDIVGWLVSRPVEEMPRLCIDLCTSYTNPNGWSVEVVYDGRYPDGDHLKKHLSRLKAKSEAPKHETAEQKQYRRGNVPALHGVAWCAASMIRSFIEGDKLPYFVDGAGPYTISQ